MRDNTHVQELHEPSKKKEKLLLYCTKSLPRMLRELDSKEIFLGITSGTYECHSSDSEYGMNCEYERDCCEHLNGKIVAECECDLVEPFTTDYRMNKEQTMRIAKDSCLTFDDLIEYEDRGNNCRCLYGLHLKNVKIFDEPKGLNDYHTNKKCNSCFTSGYESTACLYGDKCIVPAVVNRAPQSMMYVYDENGNRYILLPIHPKFMVKIMNGEKTIEVRRKILNSLKELIK